MARHAHPDTGFPSVPTFPGLRPPGMLDPSSLLQQSFPPMLNAVPRMVKKENDLSTI